MRLKPAVLAALRGATHSLRRPAGRLPRTSAPEGAG